MVTITYDNKRYSATVNGYYVTENTESDTATTTDYVPSTSRYVIISSDCTVNVTTVVVITSTTKEESGDNHSDKDDTADVVDPRYGDPCPRDTMTEQKHETAPAVKNTGVWPQWQRPPPDTLVFLTG